MIGTQMTEPPPSFDGSNQLHRNWGWKNNVPDGFLPQPPPPVYQSWRKDLTQVTECVILDQDPHSFIPPVVQGGSNPHGFGRGVHYNVAPLRRSGDEGTPRLEPPPTPPNLSSLIDDRFSYATSSSSRPNSSLASRYEEYQPFKTSGHSTGPQHSYLSTNNDHFFFKNDQIPADSKSSRNNREKKPKKSEVESELEAFAKQHDPEALLEKLKQKRMDQIKNSLLEKRAGKMNSIVNEVISDSSRLVEKDPTVEVKTEIDSLDGFDGRDDSPATSDEVIEDNYPWYIGAPLQNQIHDTVFLADDDDLYNFDGRPQKQEDDVYRSFPLKKRDLVPEKTTEADFNTQTKKILTNRTEILREDESGVVIRRGGSYSWMPSAIPEGISQNSSSTESLRSVSNSGTTPNITKINDCFEFAETQNCAAGSLCKYDHNGNGDHRKIKFCKRFMTGLCRNDDNCPNGSHALQKHQMPVCDYYWRRKCYLFQDQCPYVHVKTSASTPFCIHFNKGKCLSQQPCNFCHRYSPSIIRERGSDVSDDPTE
ncbi:hypothetical protein FO519_000805 [Halicephalobus sp. NKZ332]|nr:hypothetical protein FO519_000805 [Halicephalobus sp. NKZ332]